MTGTKKMNEKTMKTTSKKIENKITLITSILGLVIVNIIWIAGIKETNEVIQPSFTQNSQNTEIKSIKTCNMQFSLSLNESSLN